MCPYSSFCSRREFCSCMKEEDTFHFCKVKLFLQLYALIKRTPGAEELFAKSWIRPFVWLFGRLTINMSMAFAFLTFGLVKKEIWIAVNS